MGIKKYKDSMDWLDYVLLADNYLEAAEIINEDKRIDSNHGLIMPFIYLLKHAIELSLKKILKFEYLYNNNKLRIHDLKKLKKLFIYKSKKQFEKNGKSKIWNDINKDRIEERYIEFHDFIKTFEINFDKFLKKSSFVESDKLNQEQRYPYGEYTEPTTEIIDLLFNNKNKLIELATMIMLDIDIISDFNLRIKNLHQTTTD